jgi:hypothetical protein
MSYRSSFPNCLGKARGDSPIFPEEDLRNLRKSISLSTLCIHLGCWINFGKKEADPGHGCQCHFVKTCSPLQLSSGVWSLVWSATSRCQNKVGKWSSFLIWAPDAHTSHMPSSVANKELRKNGASGTSLSPDTVIRKWSS